MVHSPSKVAAAVCPVRTTDYPGPCGPLSPRAADERPPPRRVHRAAWSLRKGPSGGGCGPQADAGSGGLGTLPNVVATSAWPLRFTLHHCRGCCFQNVAMLLAACSGPWPYLPPSSPGLPPSPAPLPRATGPSLLLLCFPAAHTCPPHWVIPSSLSAEVLSWEDCPMRSVAIECPQQEGSACVTQAGRKRPSPSPAHGTR